MSEEELSEEKSSKKKSKKKSKWNQTGRTDVVTKSKDSN